MSASVSPLAPPSFPDLPSIAGVRHATRACGIRYLGRTDLLVLEMPPGTTAAGVLTRSKTRSAPVDWCATALESGSARVLVVNAGNANAFTGAIGAQAVKRTVETVATAFNCKEHDVFVSSTGVIGAFLPEQKIIDAIPDMARAMTSGSWETAARAIMTTDTFPKGATRTARIGNHEVKIVGIAKGSGMIAPDMATMLAYVFTDAALPSAVMRDLARQGAERTFNSITIDGDTSTSDTLLFFATGTAGNDAPSRAADRSLQAFKKALFEVFKDLALQIVRDGEGARKFVEIRVGGARSARAAKRIAMTVANSPLVKTAVAGEDANWGRIVAAVGRAGEHADRDRLSICIGGVEVARQGLAVPGYDETPVVAHMKGQDILIEIDVGVAKGRATVWTCDLTHGYIDVNGSYRS